MRSASPGCSVNFLRITTQVSRAAGPLINYLKHIPIPEHNAVD